jgi:hypothetical protein
LPQWFAQLEKSCGGDGNGVAVGDDMCKGLRLQTKACARIVLQSVRPALFHTRYSSVGGRRNSLCHPFDCCGGWLIHNGHWEAGAMEANRQWALGGPMKSDTQVMSEYVDKHGFAKTLRKILPPGVWLWMNRKTDELWVYKFGGSLWICEKLGALGSEPAPEGKWLQVQNGLYTLHDFQSKKEKRR